MSLELFLSQVVPVRSKLYRFAYRLLGDEEDAKDITQDALMKVWAMQGKMTELQNLEAWCMRITRNLALDKIKSRKYRIADTLDKASELPASHQKNPHAATERNEVMNKVHTAINALPEKYKSVMQLRDMDGLSYQEIADILDIDMNEVKVNLHRARKAVREKLQNQQVYGL
ncbi:RNA polymerase sigma-70 factor (ECF subfamily) [Chitinophaga dinghuensis]|uniref:RNA polymerase sigma-70 factor (ECF subfamily) n=1 Tax=Chitinophaga dinghuensis TaxID=1539050 RepID=A0A327VWD5_9BACT|nr:RNA polymerase sigma factor [Chitinophaga dinghuensis]RAJ79226.1 RNA polymerase sigma-70 factor (ECF subfamily) [Chitinophaga dinghuensis]